MAEALGYERPTKAVCDRVDEEDRRMIDGETQSQFGIELGQRGEWLINESCLYPLNFISSPCYSVLMLKIFSVRLNQKSFPQNSVIHYKTQKRLKRAHRRYFEMSQMFLDTIHTRGKFMKKNQKTRSGDFLWSFSTRAGLKSAFI